MPKTIVFRDNSHLGNLVLGNWNVFNSPGEEQKTAQKEDPQRKVEDVEFEEIQNHFRYITPACRKAGMVEHVENHLRTACSGSAEALWKCIHEYEMMEYLSTQVIDASTIYDEICAYFGALPYDKRNFRKYR